MDVFKDISMDVRQLISISEKLHSSVLRGTALTHDEIEIVRANPHGCACAQQLTVILH
jgi:hypothetical protein